MKPEKIVEGNKIIAKFDELDLPNYTDKGWVDACKYHTSWDWLIPVLEKIESLEYDTHIILTHQSNNKPPFIPVLLIGHSKSYEKDYSKIETVWTAVVEFIKWYNVEFPQK
jgi:hypothetical protein